MMLPFTIERCFEQFQLTTRAYHSTRLTSVPGHEEASPDAAGQVTLTVG